jgi:hypothetical protein
LGVLGHAVGFIEDDDFVGRAGEASTRLA